MWAKGSMSFCMFRFVSDSAGGEQQVQLIEFLMKKYRKTKLSDLRQIVSSSLTFTCLAISYNGELCKTVEMAKSLWFRFVYNGLVRTNKMLSRRHRFVCRNNTFSISAFVFTELLIGFLASALVYYEIVAIYALPSKCIRIFI